MEDSVDFLRHIFDLLNEGGVFDVHSDEQKAIIDFKHPEELKVNIFAKNSLSRGVYSTSN